MAKFYVQSGNLELVLQAHDSRCAAIWAVHTTLGQSLPFLCDEAGDYAELADLMRLGDCVTVSERGYDDAADSAVASFGLVTPSVRHSPS